MDAVSIVSQHYALLQQAVTETEKSLSQLTRCTQVISDALRAGGKLLTAGNGGSAADALHLAEELVGRYKNNRRALPAIALVADATALTCIGNDYGFEYIFSRQVEALGQEGDVLILFSTSGNSPNLLRALEVAHKRKLQSVAFLGKGGGKLQGQATVEWIVPSMDGARVQEMHGWSLHVILEVVESQMVP